MRRFVTTGWFKIQAMLGLMLLSGQCLYAQDMQAAAANEVTEESIQQCSQLEDQKPNEAVALGLSLLNQLDRQLQPVQYGKVLGCLGWSYASLDQMENARIQAIQLEQLALQMPPSDDSVLLSRRAGSVFHRIGDRVSASDNYAQALRQGETINAQEQQIPVLVNLGVLNSELREHEQAIDNYYEALKLMAEIDDFRYQPPVLFNLAATLNGQKRYTEALRVFEQVEAMINDQWPSSRTAQVYAGLAAAHSGLQQYDEAEKYAVQGLALLENSGSKYNDYYNLMSTLAAIKSYQGKFDEARTYADQVKAYFTHEDNQEILLGSANPLHALALTYERMGDLPVALEIFKLARQVEQQRQDSFNQETMAQMQARLNDSKEREELATLKNERIADQIRIKEAEHKSQVMTLSIAAVVLMFVFSVWWYVLSNKKLKKMAMTDALTGLANRRAILDWLQQRPVKGNHQRFLWLIDLDRFKQVNDEYDHDFGDHALKKISETLMQESNSDRMVGRWGGEEFMLVTDDVTEKEIHSYASHLLEIIKNTEIKKGSARIGLTASIGYSKITKANQSSSSRAMYQADKALYTAKQRGRDCAVMATGN